MYNRYVPQEEMYTPLETQTSKHGPQFGENRAAISALLSGKDRKRVLGLLKQLKPANIDSGDILVLLIALLLLSEGEDLDPVLALGIFLFLEFTDKGKNLQQ